MSVENLDFENCEVIIIQNEGFEGEQTYKNFETNIYGNKTEIKKQDFKKICRTCLSAEDLIPIFNSPIAQANGMTVDELLQDCVALQVGEQDKLPPSICRSCVRRLTKIHLFREQCHLNETILKFILINTQKELTENNIATAKQPSEENNGTAEDDTVDTNSEIGEDSMEYTIKFDEDENEDCHSHPTDSVSVGSHNSDNFENQVHGNKNAPSRLIKKVKHIFKCCKCALEFDTREDYLNHRRDAKHTAHKIHPCQVCNKMFFTSKLKQHMRTHTKEKPYECSLCKEAFSLRGNLKRHMMIHTGERPHVCQTCGKGFIQSTSLSVHQKTHRVDNTAASDKLFLCQLCGRSFKRFGPYNLHLKRHDPNCLDETGKVKIELTSDKPYKCDICDKQYRTKHLLHNHKKIHGERDFLCSGCGKGFISNSALQLHLRTHTGEKPFVCNICSKSFSYVGSFESHIRIHSGFKPYPCKICGKNFTQQGHLVSHMRTHNGERPYVCPYCGKSFSLNGNLTVHIRTHTGETPYMCEICGKGFYDSSSRKKHQRSHGNSDIIQETDNIRDNDLYRVTEYDIE